VYYSTAGGDDAIRQLGIADNNYYARPIDDTDTMVTETNAWSGPTIYRTLSGWQSYTGLDYNSKKSPITISSINDILFYYNEQNSSKNIALPSGNYVDVKNQPYSRSITLVPWTSITLMKKN
jgi:hypothetical protein